MHILREFNWIMTGFSVKYENQLRGKFWNYRICNFG